MPTPGNPVCKKTIRGGGPATSPDAIRGERRVVFILSNGRGGPLGRAESSRIVKNTYEKGFPGDPVCKKTVRETCDVQKHTMKCQVMVEGAPSERPKAIGSSKAHMKKGFPGNRVCKKTVRETCDVRKHTMKCRFPGILCGKKQYAEGCRTASARHRGRRGSSIHIE